MPRPVVCVTGGDTRTTMALAALEAQLATGPLHAVTHLVCGGLEPSQPPRRTLKLLYALARGAPVDQHWWPQASNCALRHWLPAYDAALRMDGVAPMPRLLRCVLNATARNSHTPKTPL